MKSNSSDSPHYLVLEDSELLFKMVFNQPLQFMAILSPEGRVLEINELAIKYQNVTRDDYIGKLFWESPAWRNLPEWENIWKKRLIEASNQQSPVITEDVFQVEDGSVHYADASTTAIYNPINDQLVGYLVQATDITKRRLIENQIQENEARLNIALERSHIGHWELNLIDNTSHRSLRHDQIFGYESLLSHWNYETFLKHVMPEDRVDVDDKFQTAIQNIKDWNIECRIMRNDGDIRWILASGGHSFNAAGEVKLMTGIVQDITEIKQAETNRLRHSAELESLFKALPDTYFRMKTDGTILDYHTQNKSDLYIKPDDFLGKRMQDILPQNIAALFQLKIDEVTQTEKTVIIKYELIINNEVIHFDARLNRIPLNDQLICVIRDVTEEFKSKQDLAISEQLFRTIFEQAAVGVALVRAGSGVFIRINQRFCDMLGFSEEEMLNDKTFQNITHPEDLQADLNNLDKVLKGQQREFTREKRYIHKNGHIVWAELNASPTWKMGEQPQSFIVVVQDISERKKAQEKLQLSYRVFSDTHEGIIITDPQQRIVDINPAFTQITGYSWQDIIGKSPSILGSGMQSPQFYTEMWQSVVEHGYWQGELWNRTKQGELYAELLAISSLKNEHDEITHYVGMFSDITSNKRQQDQLNLMAHYDVLTKLPNRALFVDRFHQAVAHSSRAGHQFAVCFLDLDNFKPVNDNYGHEAGDRLLVEVAERIKACIREEDTVSRQGGDEFAILLNDIESASQYEGSIKRIHQALAQPYFINDIQHHITASSGVTLYPADNGDIDTLLRHADHAMYQSKLAGKGRTQLYSPASDQRIIHKNLQLEEIERALLNNEFQLYYQPKVNMVTGNVFGVEALIRWNNPEKGVISPLKFLPFVNDTPLEIKIGKWVIKEALQQLDDWQQQGIKLEVSVNISSNHLLSPFFVIDLENSLAKCTFSNAQHLQLEILESSVFGDINTINHIVETCKKRLGVSFALDDFGTGYSSLTHLRNLPVNMIKIDQSFVRDMIDDPSDYSIIEGVIALTKSFDRNVIAEGVENTHQGHMLLLMGCGQAQGFEIAKPMPAAVFSRWLSDYVPNKNWLICGNKQRNNKENSLDIFRLINEQWIEKFKRKIISLPDDIDLWPVLDNQLCQCGHWIHREKQELLFEQEGIRRLEQAHNKVHVIANEIQQKCKNGDIKAGLALLAELELAGGEVKNAISLCE